MYENVTLIEELNKIRNELSESQKTISKLESLFGLSRKSMPATVARKMLSKAVANYDEIEEKHMRERSKLEVIIQTLSTDNEQLKTKLIEANKKKN